MADPNATPNEAVQKAVGSVLRMVCLAMLDGSTANQESTMKEIATSVAQDAAFADGVVKSLAYMRDRVGVPRDMSFPAARQLRAADVVCPRLDH